MGRNRLAALDTVRVALSDGDWIELKQELNAGEHLDMITTSTVVVDGELRPDYRMLSLARILAYLIRWSFTGRHGEALPYALDDPIDLRRATLRELTPATYRELVAAVDAHEAQEAAARDAKKNILTGVGT
jgi:hypothetical protein